MCRAVEPRVGNRDGAVTSVRERVGEGTNVRDVVRFEVAVALELLEGPALEWLKL